MNMRFLFLIALIEFVQVVAAQNKIVRYYDDAWADCDPGKSTYYAEFVKEGMRYNCVFYWTGSNKVAGKGTYLDTAVTKPVGLLLGYTKNGTIEDSILYDDTGNMIELFHYYKNKQLEVHYSIPEGKKDPVVEAFDETGKKIKNYIFSKEAEFKGGDKSWQNYILKTANKELRTKDNNSARVTVKIMFVVNEFGYTAKPKVMESSGFNHVDRDAINVILGSPQWSNAIYLNKPVKVYRIQSITYELKPGK